MPSIIDYSAVLSRMTSAGFRCNYHNSGAFGFPAKSPTIIRGWIGPPDLTIKSSLLPFIKSVPPPYESNLAAAAAGAWTKCLPGPVWVMPMSHWHFELHDGSRDWMPSLLKEIGVDPAQLESRADGSAIEFTESESARFTQLLAALLSDLRVSDFSMAFPGHQVVCMVHHHKQLWWTAADVALIDQISASLRLSA